MKRAYVVEVFRNRNGIPTKYTRSYDSEEKAYTYFDKARRSALLINVFCRATWTDTTGKTRTKDGPAIAHYSH